MALKKDILKEIEEMNLDLNTLLHMMFDWFEDYELEEFIEHIKDELTQ